MLFGLIGKYNPMMLKTVIAKEDEVFNNPPEGIEVVARYAIVGERGGFINIVKTTQAEALGILLSSFVGLIHFDSHSDLWHDYFDGKDTHGTPFRRALEEGLIDPQRSCQIGSRGSLYDKSDCLMTVEEGMLMVDAPQLHEQGSPKTLEQIIAKAGEGPLYITFDIDSLDPGYAPGTGTPEIAGLTPPQALQLIRGLRGLPIVGLDLVEVAPAYDTSGNTALLGANIAYEMLCALPSVPIR